MKFKAEHVFKGISIADYEKLYFDEDFSIALCKEVKLARSLKSLETKDVHLSRAVTVGPEREIPGPVAKIVGANRIEYTEYVEYDMGSYKGEWKTISSVLTDKIDTKGTFEFQEVSGGVKRIIHGDIKVKIFGIGGVVEKFIVSDVEKSYNDAAVFTQKWIDEGKV